VSPWGHKLRVIDHKELLQLYRNTGYTGREYSFYTLYCNDVSYKYKDLFFCDDSGGGVVCERLPFAVADLIEFVMNYATEMEEVSRRSYWTKFKLFLRYLPWRIYHRRKLSVFAGAGVITITEIEEMLDHIFGKAEES
jgi:hypothetical protein